MNKKIWFVLIFSIILGSFLFLGLAAKAEAATYYMRADGTATKANAIGPCSSASASMSVATHNAATFTAGDTIIVCGNGGVFSSQVTIPSSGLVGSIINYVGSGYPVVSAAGYNLRIATRQYLTFTGIDFTTGEIYITASTDITFNHCLMRNGTSYGLIGASTSTITLNNSDIINNTSVGVDSEDAGTIITVRNCIVNGNGYYGLKATSGGVLNYSYSLVWANGTLPSYNMSGATDLGNNITDNAAHFKSYANNNAYFVFSSDESGNDYDFDYFDSIVSTFAPYGAKASFFIEGSYVSSGKYSTLASYAAAGHEVASHSWSVTRFDRTDAFTVTTTNTNPTVNVDRTTKTIVFSCDEVGNRVTVNWSSVAKSIADVKAAVAGKGWTITNSTNINDPLRMISAASTGGAQAVPYTVTLDVSAVNGYPFWNDEIITTASWIQGITGVAPATYVYPFGISSTSMDTFFSGTSMIAGGAVSGWNNNVLSSINVYEISRISASRMKTSGLEADTRACARYWYEFAKHKGGIAIFLSHSTGELTIAQLGWFTDELYKLGGQFITFKDAMTTIRADHTTVDNITYTKTYPDLFNGQLQSTSPAIDAGVNVGLTTDLAGNPIYGTPDIGGYEYQPPHTIGTNNIDIGAGARIYSDGKFRDVNTTSGISANLSIAPSSGSFPVYSSSSTPRNAYLDVSVSTWSSTEKTWTESNASSGITNTIHTVGDLSPNNYYKVVIDGIDAAAQITGSNCGILNFREVCQANSSGQVVFTYTGSYSTHTFDLSQTSGPAVASAGGGMPSAWYNQPQTPIGGFSISINNGNQTTTDSNVTLNLKAGTDTSRMAISNYSDFRGAGQENYVPTKTWNLCWNNSLLQTPSTCPSGNYTVYTQFYAPWGKSSGIVSDSIVLNTNGSSLISNFNFTKPLYFGLSNTDVKNLQTCLKVNPITGYFGNLTKKAVQNFQEKYNLASQGDYAYGYVGPKTRAKLNELIGK